MEKARIGNATFISPENVLEEGRLKDGGGAEGHLSPGWRKAGPWWSTRMISMGLLWCGLLCRSWDLNLTAGFTGGRS